LVITNTKRACVKSYKHFGALCKPLETSWISSFFAPTQVAQQAGLQCCTLRVKTFH